MVLIQQCPGPASGHEASAKTCKVSECNFLFILRELDLILDQYIDFKNVHTKWTNWNGYKVIKILEFMSASVQF